MGFLQGFGNLRLQVFQAFPGLRGNQDRAGEHRIRITLVALVDDFNPFLLCGAQFRQDFFHGVMLAEHFLAGAVGNNHQHVRQGRFLQRGAEGADQRMGQLADKADGVRQQILCVLGRRHPAGHRVQRGKQLVLHIDVGPGQGVQQGGLAGVGIAHQRHYGNLVAFPALPPDAALLFQLVQPPSQLCHPFPDTPPVHFQLAFAGTPGTDTAGQPAQGQSLSDQPGGAILQLGQFHLEFTFRAGGALGKDIQDQRCPVNHLHPEDFLQVPDLDAGQFFIENTHVRFQRLAFPGQFLRPAFADEHGAVRLVPLLQEAADDLRPGGFRQAGQLFQGLLAFNAHEHGLFPAVLILFGFFPAHQLVALQDLAQPLFFRQPVPAFHGGQHHFRVLNQECGLDVHRFIVLHAHRRHGVVTEDLQGAQVHVAQPAVSVRMGVHAAHTAQAARIPPQPEVRQLHVAIRADGHVHDLPVPGNIDRDLPVQGAGAFRQQLHQLPGQELILFQLIGI